MNTLIQSKTFGITFQQSNNNKNKNDNESNDNNNNNYNMKNFKNT